MKDILRLPVLFLFFFVLFFLFFFGLSLLAQWGSGYSEGRETALQAVEARMLQTLLNVLPAAVLYPFDLRLPDPRGAGSR